MAIEELIERARAWIAEDPDPQTRAAAEALIARRDEVALRDHFGERLTFGTAGLRGALGPGPNRMNRLLVRRVTAGLSAWLRARHERPRVVIGFDARIGSREFARDAAGVLSACGADVLLFPDVVPTPELAHAVTWLECHAGIMVTASHNPPGDNGYKVYAANGAQIVPPMDREISEAIDAVAEAPPVHASAGRPVPPEAREAYVRGVMNLRVHRETGARVVYTAMHGVGAERVRQVFEAAGHELHPVTEQCDPDGTFPTVSFPNPEEPGALDLALALARRVDADIVLANDPDADRLAVAVPTGGSWRQLTGNEVGCLLAEDLLTHGPQGSDRMVATTIVSSSLLSRIAQAHGARYAETLTGFKWIANAAIPHTERGGAFVLGFEEALGYSVGSLVRDKDGVSAALLLADLASWCKARGETLLDRLTALYRRYGVHASAQHSLRLPDGPAGAQRRQEIMDLLRRDPPTALAGADVVAIRDVLTGEARDTRTGEITPLTLPRSDVLAFDLADGSRVLCRPSGTEPKMKLYFEVREPLKADEPLASAEGRATVRLAALRDSMLGRVA